MSKCSNSAMGFVSLWLSLVLALCVVGIASPAQAVSLSDANVQANDDLDAYVGTGGLLLPRSFQGPPRTRTYVANCLSCVWQYTLYCAQGAEVACAHAVVTCPAEEIRYRVKFGATKENVHTVGSVCWGIGYPATRQDVIDRIQEDALRAVPALRPGCSPCTRSLTGLPLIVWAGQPTVYRAKPMTLSGLRVVITARPLWRWSWGDSSHQWTSDSGSPTSRSGPTHRYSSPGQYHIDVHAVWTAQYAISGVGTYTLEDAPVNQFAQLHVQVVPIVTRLVAHSRVT